MNITRFLHPTRLSMLMAGSIATLTPIGFALGAVQSASAAQPQAVQQQSVVTGTVVDERGETVIGATVRVQGTKEATITDFDGNFKIKARKGQKLIVSYVGYESKTVVVKGNTVKITLTEDQNMLQGVEVVAYGVQKKVTVTGAISSVGGEELAKTPVSSVTNVLAGQISGVSSIQYSGEPGSDNATLFLRGKGTFSEDGTTPLIQIDGVTCSMSDFALIDANEIESVSVLKDASATAVFGVEGANGVILVTTKRGKEGKAKITFSSTESLVMPTSPIETVGSYEYATFHNMTRRYDGAEEQFSAEALQKFKDHSDPIRFPDTDWVDFCMKKSSLQTQNNMSITGGTSSVRYFMSVGMLTQGGLFKQFDLPYDMSYQYKRFNYRANLDMDVTKTTTLSMSMSGRLDKRTRPKSGSGDSGTALKNMYAATPFSSPGFVDGKFVTTATDYDDITLPFTGGNGLTSYWGSGNHISNRNALTVALQLDQKLDMITKGLKFRLKGSYSSDFTSAQSNSAEVATYRPYYIDGVMKYKKTGQDTPIEYGDETTGKSRSWYFEASLNWTRKFGYHNVSALLVYNQRKSYYPGGNYDDIPRGLVGMAARLTYDWRNRYMVEFNVGHNGSENFAPGKRFGWFPAGSAGWIVSEEPFFKPIKKVVNYLKFRASVGLVGKDNTSDRFYYTSDPYSSNSGGYYFGIDSKTKTPGAAAGAKHNADVGWEKALKQDYGVDASFIGERVKATFDYYKEHRTGILLSNGMAPAILGFSLPMANLGEVDSWGWELSLSWNDKIGKDFRYWIKGNLSYNQNEIVDMKEVPQDEPYMYQTGRRIGTRSLYKFYKLYYEGIEEDYEKEFGTPFPRHGGTADNPTQLKPGDAVYVDLNKDGVIDNKDCTRDLDGIYTDDPEYTIGVNLGFSYKHWNFSMQWSGAWNVSRCLTGAFRQPFYSASDVTQGGLLKYVYENSWTEENPDPNAKYPRPTFARTSNYYDSQLYIRNSSYLRLKSLNISYDFDFPFMKRIKLNQLQVGLSGYNLFTITDYIWGDPEGRATATPTYPLTKTYAINIKIGF